MRCNDRQRKTEDAERTLPACFSFIVKSEQKKSNHSNLNAIINTLVNWEGGGGVSKEQLEVCKNVC